MERVLNNPGLHFQLKYYIFNVEFMFFFFFLKTNGLNPASHLSPLYALLKGKNSTHLRFLNAFNLIIHPFVLVLNNQSS